MAQHPQPTDPAPTVAPGAPSLAPHVRTSIGECWIDADRIVWIRVHPGAVMGAPEARESLVAGQSLTRGLPYRLLIDASGLRLMNRSAREMMSSRGSAPDAGLLAAAIVVRSPLARMFGNFFIGFNRPAVPVRLFNDEAPALEWLRTMTAGT